MTPEMTRAEKIFMWICVAIVISLCLMTAAFGGWLLSLSDASEGPSFLAAVQGVFGFFFGLVGAVGAVSCLLGAWDEVLG